MSENKGNFKRVITKIRKFSERLQEMMVEDIPESLPAIEPPEGHDSSFNHFSTDFPGMFDFPSFIPDSLAPMSVIEELESIIIASKMLIEDLYPRNLVSGQTVLKVRGEFRSIQNSLNQFIDDLQTIKQILTQMQSSRLSLIIDRSALRELKKRLIRIGWEYVHNGFKLPIEFQSNESIVYNKKALQKLDRALPPQIEQFRDNSIQIFKNDSSVTSHFSPSTSNLMKKYRS